MHAKLCLSTQLLITAADGISSPHHVHHGIASIRPNVHELASYRKLLSYRRLWCEIFTGLMPPLQSQVEVLARIQRLSKPQPLVSILIADKQTGADLEKSGDPEYEALLSHYM